MIEERMAPPEAPPPPDLTSPALYINRELSWLDFNRRVLHEALDSRIPLLERVKFLAIFASNLDEFFQVRVACIREQVLAHLVELTPDGMLPEMQLRTIAAEVRRQLAEHGKCLCEEIVPGLAEHGIELVMDPD